MAPSGCLSSNSLRRAPGPLRRRSPRLRPSRSPAAGKRSPQSPSTASPTESPTCLRVEARSSNFSKGRSCLQSRSWSGAQPLDPTVRGRLLCRAGLDSGSAAQIAMHPRNPLYLSLGGEALVEALHAKCLDLLFPRAQAFLPALQTAFGRLAIFAGEVGAHADHRLQRHRPGHHVVGVAPSFVPNALGCLEEVAHHRVVARDLLAAAARDLDAAPVAIHPAVQLVEQLCLQNPLVLLAAPAEPVDAVAQGTVPLAVEAAHEARGELAVGFGPGYP